MKKMILCCIWLLLSPTVYAAPSEQEVAERYVDQLHYKDGPIFKKENTLSLPLPEKGELTESFLLQGLRATNFARYLANMPDDVQWRADLNEAAQIGAALLSVSGQSLTHHPTKIANIDDDFYQQGYAATSSSNLGLGYDSLQSSILEGYMEDGDESNIDRVGHRRWVLNPQLQFVGFGFTKQHFTALKVFDYSREKDVDYDFIAYPSTVPMPLTVFRSDYPWHITLNPERYDTDEAALADIVVTVVRQTDQRRWSWRGSDEKGEGKQGYFNLDFGAYGVDNAIIFRPNLTLTQGERYAVTITGVTKKDGTKTTIHYEPQFFNPIVKEAIVLDKTTFKQGETIRLNGYTMSTGGKQWSIPPSAISIDSVQLSKAGKVTKRYNTVKITNVKQSTKVTVVCRTDYVRQTLTFTVKP